MNTENPSDAARNEIASDNRDFHVQSELLIGGRGFLDELAIEVESIQEDIKAIDSVSEAYKDAWKPQKEQLEEQLNELFELRAAAIELSKVIKTKRPTREVGRQWCNRLMEANSVRKFRNLRVQGPLVFSKPFLLEKCGGSVNTTIELLAEHLSKLSQDQKSPFASTPFWRFYDAKNHAIWLYFHNETEKYLCQFYRFGVSRSGTTVMIELEAYIPFGSFNDPAQYELEASDAFTRPGWLSVEVESRSLSITDTFNLSYTNSQNYNHTIGRSESETNTRSSSKAIGNTLTKSLSEQTSLTHSSNWSTAYSYTQSQHNASTNSSGHGGGSSHTTGQTFSESNATSETETIGDSYSRQVGGNSSVSKGRALSECRGVSSASGRSFQVTLMKYGIAFGKSNEVHAKKWAESHPEAGRVYNRLFTMFDDICNQIALKLQSMMEHQSDLTDDELLEKITTFIPTRDTKLLEEMQKKASVKLPRTGTLDMKETN